MRNRGRAGGALLAKPDLLILANAAIILVAPFLMARWYDEDMRKIRAIEADRQEASARILRISRNRPHGPYLVDYEFFARGRGIPTRGQEREEIDIADPKRIPVEMPVVYSRKDAACSMSLERFTSRDVRRHERRAILLAGLAVLLLLARGLKRRAVLRHGVKGEAVIERIQWLVPGPPLGLKRIDFRIPEFPELAPLREHFNPVAAVVGLKEGDQVDVMYPAGSPTDAVLILPQ